jgi:AAA15 family ATPase/GTPase
MIKNLNIQNFKSIKHLHLDCKKINIFIGKPNTGKSNLLESIGLFSAMYGRIGDFVRFGDNLANIFSDGELSENILVTADDYSYEINFSNERFRGKAGDKEKKIFHFEFDYGYNLGGSSGGSGNSPFKFYRFVLPEEFKRQEYSFLLPPNGENLLFVIQTNRALRKLVSDIFSEYGLKVVLKPQDKKIEIQKEKEDVVISHPLSLVSDTLLRVVFHLAAIETNKDSIIIFEEPEAHAFPYYTKFLSETIALDETNQYFVSTHNPYFLLSVLEKAPKDEIRIFITNFQEYQTKVRPISVKEMPEVLDLGESIFFNLDRFLEEE